MPALQYVLKIYLSLTPILEYDLCLEWSQFVALRQRVSFFQLFCGCVETHSDDDGDFSSKYDCGPISQLLLLSLWYTIGVSKITIEELASSYSISSLVIRTGGKSIPLQEQHLHSKSFHRLIWYGWAGSHVSEEQHYNTIDSGQSQRWSFMTFLYLSVSSSCYQCESCQVQNILLGALHWDTIRHVCMQAC